MPAVREVSLFALFSSGSSQRCCRTISFSRYFAVDCNVRSIGYVYNQVTGLIWSSHKFTAIESIRGSTRGNREQRAYISIFDPSQLDFSRISGSIGPAVHQLQADERYDSEAWSARGYILFDEFFGRSVDCVQSKQSVDFHMRQLPFLFSTSKFLP